MTTCAPRSSSWSPRASSLDLLFVLDPLDSLKAYKDSSVAMMRAAQARGHGIYACEVADLGAGAGPVAAGTRRLSLLASDDDWYRAGAGETRALRDFDAVLMRK